MLNERDGGIGRGKTRHPRTPGRDDAQKGVQCHDSVKGRNPVVITPYSTEITEQLIPKAAVDKFRFCYGLSASADGQLFPWVFNPPDTYWDGASAFIRHVADVEGSFAKLKGKTIGLVYLDAPYGKEPIPLSQALANDYGYTGHAAPGLHQPSVQNQITGVKSRYGNRSPELTRPRRTVARRNAHFEISYSALSSTRCVKS